MTTIKPVSTNRIQMNILLEKIKENPLKFITSLFILIILYLLVFKRDLLYLWWSKFLTIFGKIMLSTSPPLIRANHIRKCQGIVQAGDILCRRFDCYLDGIFIPGKYSHSGFMINGDKIIDAVAEGVDEKDVIDFIKDTDGFIILRPEYKTEQDKNNAIEFAKSQIGMPYDFIFKDGNDAYYCHEFTVSCLSRAGIEIQRNGKVYLASDLEKACKRVYESDDPIFKSGKKQSFVQKIFPVRYYPKK